MTQKSCQSRNEQSKALAEHLADYMWRKAEDGGDVALVEADKKLIAFALRAYAVSETATSKNPLFKGEVGPDGVVGRYDDKNERLKEPAPKWAAARIRQLERELAEAKEDLAKAIANHAADLTPSAGGNSELADRLEALGAKATPGPWAWDQRGEKVNEWGLGTAFDEKEQPLAGRFDDENAIYDEYVCSHEAATCNYTNPHLICALRNNLPAIIAALRCAPSHVERRFQICKDHENAEWNQPTLDGDDCILCRLFYLEAQESLLEEWQQRALRAEGAIAEIQRPLDAQMARLNATVVRLNEENERLRSAPSATGSAEWAEDARPWEMRDGDVTFLWMDDGIEVVAMSHGKRWRTVLPLPVRRTERTVRNP